MKPFQLLAAFFALGCAQAPAQDNQAQDNQAGPQPAAPAGPAAGIDSEQEAIMARIEREIRLPEGAAPLASYARFYAWQQREDGRRKVLGVWLGIGDRTPGRRWVTETEFPLILDGGCGLISLSYDADAQRIEHVTCNGEA